MMILRLSRLLPLIAYFLISLLAVISIPTQEALAFKDWSHISAEVTSPVELGQSLTCNVTVQNTGTERWGSSDFGNTPTWIIKIADLSWLPNTYYAFYMYKTVSVGARASHEAILTADKLPSSEGNYSFQVYTYRPSDLMFDSNYYLMDNSPKSVNFTMIPEPPVLSVSTASLNQRCALRQNASRQSFEVWNSGQGPLTYSITDDIKWLSVSPDSGSCTGERDVIEVNYDTSGLPAGTHNGTITVTATGVRGSPQTITVTLRVSPAGMPWIQLLLD